ncbi:transmembrane protein, putative [Medicago truncatula]|uniref:Transmembrane protein, putative n=1 Tax=Medicago truncatula TaxID=3880 RepID=G7ILV0_MEDTR|nr:transmembrane protein, putative [Medicago truncatula]
MGSKIPSLSCVIILLMLLALGISATRSNFQAMEKGNNRKEASTMLMVDNMSKSDSGKTSLFLLAKRQVPPSGPSHRGNNAPH